jgi:hypothetical protein
MRGNRVHLIVNRDLSQWRIIYPKEWEIGDGRAVIRLLSPGLAKQGSAKASGEKSKPPGEIYAQRAHCSGGTRVEADVGKRDLQDAGDPREEATT